MRSIRVGTRYVSRLTTITYIVTAIVDDVVELKLDKDSINGLFVSNLELQDKYLEVVDPYESNFLH